MKNNNIYIFDVDGTLTPPRKPMDNDFAKKFYSFLQSNFSYIVSGSDYTKIKTQIPLNLINIFKGIFCSMGNELFINEKLIYDINFTPEPFLLTTLEEFRRNTKYKGTLYPNYIEVRKGMVNFAVLGRNCPLEARKQYNAWDNINKEREHIYKQLINLFPNYDISIGGEISIDITPNGKGKEQVLPYLRNIYPNATIVFCGDRVQPGGNDYTLAQSCIKDGNAKVIEISSPQDLLKSLSIK